MIRHLYVHIPFCPKICPYCSFYKEASDRNKTQPFLEAVLREAEEWAENLVPRTIFFGGGTPTALSPAQLEFLLAGLHERIDLSHVEEWTFEMNPATVSLEKAVLLRELGVNRVSMGVQAWQPHLLKVLGRVHSAEQAQRSWGLLREAGFIRLNMDLIFGVPGQTEADWRDSLERTMALQPEHISAYCLTYEEDTAFFEELQQGRFRIEEEREILFFKMTRELLGRGGWPPYEISNFAVEGAECQHNLAYWEGADYVGLGPSAFSTVGTRRWRNVRNTEIYTAGSLAGRVPRDFEEEVPPSLREREKIAFGLRTRRGVEKGLLKAERVAPLVQAGLLEQNGEFYRLTSGGCLVADEIAAELWE